MVNHIIQDSDHVMDDFLRQSNGGQGEVIDEQLDDNDAAPSGVKCFHQVVKQELEFGSSEPRPRCDSSGSFHRPGKHPIYANGSFQSVCGDG